MRKITYEEALNRIAERTTDNIRELRKTRLQRRTEFTDLYGIPFYAESDADNKAVFYISVTPDQVYTMRLQFKLHIRDTSSDEFNITVNGVEDIQDYLIAQHEGEWINGAGLYPTDELEDVTDFYDLMAVATDIYNEGSDEEHTKKANRILNPGFKEVVIQSDAPFKVTMYLYPKQSVTGR